MTVCLRKLAPFAVDDPLPTADATPKPTTTPPAGSEPEPRMDVDW